MISKIKKYDGPAGGWGAVKALSSAFIGQKNLQHDVIAMFKMNKGRGFDCPGCAWPDEKHASVIEICENGAKALSWEATSKKTTPEFFAKHTVTELLGWSDYDLENQGRLTHPMKYDAVTDTYQPIEWQRAFDEIGTQLQRYTNPNSVEFYTSGRTSNEAAFLYQIYAREYGTNNFPDCSNMCHEPTSVGLASSIGIGKGTVLLEDFEHADLVICIGHNPGTNHPRMLGTLRKVSKRGATIVAVNPLKERGLERFANPQSPVEMLTLGSTQLASHYYQVRIGGDTALLKGLMKIIIEKHDKAIANGEAGILDLHFITEHTDNFDHLRQDIVISNWDDILSISGLTYAQIEELADIYIKAERTIICYGMGITQHQHGTQNVQQLVNLLLLKGNIGRQGAGICPLRGHSNVQGDRTVGINEKPTQALLDNIEKRFGFKSPTAHGHAAVETMHAIYNGESKALIAMGGNLAVAMSDHEKTFSAMHKLDLAVHAATKLNRSHLLLAKDNYIFPVLGRTEIDIQQSGPQCVTVEDSMSMVHASQGRLKPVSPDLKSECAIVAGLAKATLPNSRVEWDEFIANYDKIRDAIEAVFPDFKDFNQRIKTPGGFHLVNSAAERRWKTPSGKANFIIAKSLIEDYAPTTKETLRLTTVRSHDQYNTTIYSLNDRYRGITGRRDVIFINEAEANRQNIKAGDVINVVALDQHNQPTHRRLDGLTVVIYDIADKCLATYFPESNNLVPLEHSDPLAGIPAYKNIPIMLEKTA